jgi:hypothetical protein
LPDCLLLLHIGGLEVAAFENLYKYHGNGSPKLSGEASNEAIEEDFPRSSGWKITMDQSLRNLEKRYSNYLGDLTL